MWLHPVLFVQLILIGFSWPVIQAAYRDDASPKRGRYIPASPTVDYPATVYPARPGLIRNVDPEVKQNNPEDLRPRPRPVYPSEYYNKNTQDRLTDGPVSIPPPLNPEKVGPSPVRTASSSETRWPSNDRRMVLEPTRVSPRPINGQVILSQTVLNTDLGVALIYSRESGLICSGAHLKPWILLTTADCVYGKHHEDLYAKVMKRDEKNGPPVMVQLDVEFYELHPGYRYADYESHNLAILLLNSKYNWVVDEFVIPNPVKDDIIPDRAVTYVNEWNEWMTPSNTSYVLSTEEKSIKKNYTAPNGDKTDKNFFWVLTGPYAEVYKQVQIGIPLFYKMGASKVLVGVYPGGDLNKGVTGHMFLSIYDNVFWVTEKLLEYPLPPAIHHGM